MIPSDTRKPATRSKSSPGVRIVTENDSWPILISSGSSTASTSSRWRTGNSRALGEPSRTYLCTLRRCVTRPISGRAGALRALLLGFRTLLRGVFIAQSSHHGRAAGSTAGEPAAGSGLQPQLSPAGRSSPPGRQASRGLLPVLGRSPVGCPGRSPGFGLCARRFRLRATAAPTARRMQARARRAARRAAEPPSRRRADASPRIIPGPVCLAGEAIPYRSRKGISRVRPGSGSRVVPQGTSCTGGRGPWPKRGQERSPHRR